MELGSFVIERVIIHHVPKTPIGGKQANKPKLAERVSILKTEHRLYFRERINETMKEGFQVRHDTGSSSPVPQLMVDYWKGSTSETAFIELSRSVADRLHRTQPGNSNDGWLTVLEGTIGPGQKGAGKLLAYLKLELVKGVALTASTKNGKRGFDPRMGELTLTRNTRVFKASVFKKCKTLASLQGEVSDHQYRGFGEDVAAFFRKSFLGCDFPKAADRATEDAFETVIGFTNTLDSDHDKQDLLVAVIAEMQSADAIFDPQGFAKRYVPATRKDDFVNLFRREDGSVDKVVKDVTRIRSRLRNGRVRFENGLVLYGDPGVLDASVHSDNGVTTIASSIDEVGSRG